MRHSQHAQINLVVGNMLKACNFIDIMEGALEIVKWFNNHGLALAKLRGVCLHKLGKMLCLILPVITRWTSHYLCVRRLLRLELVFGQLLLDSQEEILACAGHGQEAKDKAREIVDKLRQPSFWTGLKRYVSEIVRKCGTDAQCRVELHLEPLAQAANATQSDCARLDIVLVTLANLFHYFSSTGP